MWKWYIVDIPLWFQVLFYIHSFILIKNIKMRQDTGIWCKMHALCLYFAITRQSNHEIFTSEPLHFPGYWLDKFKSSSLWLVNAISGWLELLASSSFSAMGWTSSTCWRCSPTTWSWAWPTWRPVSGRARRGRECYPASRVMSHTGQLLRIDDELRF